MGSVTVRDVDDDLKQRIRIRAAANGHSMETEIRLTLRAAFRTEDSMMDATNFGPAGKEQAWVKAMFDSCLGIESMAGVPVPRRVHGLRSIAGRIT